HRQHDRDHHDLQCGPAAPHDPGPDIEVSLGGAQQVVGARWPVLREHLAGLAHLGKSVRRDPRREDREDHEDADDHHTAEQNPPCQSGGLAKRCGELFDDAHQYRTLGSVSALMMSISRLTTTTTTAKIVMIPCTAA